MQKRPVFHLLLLSLLAMGFSPARAQLTITANFTTPDTTDFGGSTPVANAANAATIENTIDQALDQITSTVTTNTPENLTVSFLSDPNTGLGASVGTGTIDINYSTYLADLTANPNKSVNDVTALASLAAHPYSPTQQISLGGADLLAIGDTVDGNSLISGNGNLAGTVALNFNLLDDSRTNPPAGSYDLVSTVTHEVDEVLGIGGAGSTLAQGGGSTPADRGAMDLFRYSAAGTRTFTTTAVGPAYFSINGGVKNLVNFNQLAGGDFADWGDGTTDGEGNTPAQVQDAFGGDAAEASPNIGPNELTALDVVGYTLTAQGMIVDGVPEPNSVYLLLGGLFTVGCVYWRRQVA